MIEAKIDRQHQEDLQRLRGFCLLDDEFMVKCLEDETACMELILRIILEKPDLRVTKVDGRDYDYVPPQRSLQLDVWATDSQEKKIFVRFKKIGPGVEKCHVRYSSSISDVDLVRFCGDIQNLPDLYIVLITENDDLGGGFPSHRIQWYDQTLGVPFEDGTHVIYVNGAYRGDSPIGKLVHNLMCTDPSKMYYRALADRVHFYKETEEGAAIMCRAMEASREQCMAYYKQVFTSRTLAGHFEDMAAAQTRRYHYNRRVRVQLAWKPEASGSANTNNEVININAGHTMVTQEKGRQNRYQMVCGLFTHELGHVLYTDFLAPQTQMNYLERGLWYPDPPALRTSAEFANEKALWAYIKADWKNLEAVKTVAHHIMNVLEGGYIENRMLAEFPGTLGFALETMRMGQLKEMSTVTQMKEAEEDGRFHILDSILLAMLDYVKYGEIRYGDEPLSDLRIQTIFGLINELDRAVSEHHVKARLDACNLFLVRCWEYIQDYCEQIKARMDGEDTESLGEKVAKRLGILPGTTVAGVGGVPVAGGTGVSAAPATAASRAKTHAEAEEEANAENNTSEDEDTDSVPENNPDTESPEDDPEQTMLMDGSSDIGKQDVSDQEGGRIPYHQTDSVSEPIGGTTEYNADYEREQYDKAASDIERVLDKMAERAACEQLENDRLRELNEMANNISYGDIHKGVHVRINRIASVDEELVEQYDSIAPQLLTISRQLQRSITKELKEHRRGGKQTGLVLGRRLDTHALCRGDGKVFYKNALPNEIPELAVGLLVDESGSMYCADRATYARAAAIILHDFCEGLEIPVMVYGHSTGRGSYGNMVEMYSYAEFEGFDRDDKYRLMDISARDNNRDGAALRYVAEKLSDRPEAVKLLILVSDGQPADMGYSGTAAEEDLRGIKQEYQRKGVIFVAAAIGEDKPSIQRIYGDSFLDITDLEKLPAKLTAVVKKHIRI